MRDYLKNIYNILNLRNIILFIFCLIAVSINVYLHESAHYIAAKHANMNDPQIHFASMTIKDNLTLGTPEETTRQISLSNFVILKASGPLLTIILSLTSIIFLIRRYNDFIFIFGLVPFVRSFFDSVGLFTGQIIGDEFFLARLFAYYTPWWKNAILITLLFLIIMYIEFSISFYIIIVYLKKRNVWGADYLVKFPQILIYPFILIRSIISFIYLSHNTSRSKNKKTGDELLRIWSIFTVILFWYYLWMIYIGPRLLP